jgi:hypothetical protein
VSDNPSKTRSGELTVQSQVVLSLALFALARGLLILSAPDVLVMVDQATWKHADLATDLRAGQLPGLQELASLAWDGFNFHQVAFIPYSLGFALFALPFGGGYVPLHLYAAGFSALGIIGWYLLLARHGPRHSAIAFGVFSALAPIPAALMQVRPYSGHTEAQGLAVLAVAILLRRDGSLLSAAPRHLFASGLVAGMALSLSPLSAPLLACAGLAIAACLFLGSRPDALGRKLSIAAVGGLLGMLPYVIRALFAPEDMFSMPVVEYDQADPASILKGLAGPTLATTLTKPFHLIVNLSSVTQAHSYKGLIDGDSLLANLTLVASSLLCLFASIRAATPKRRVLGLLLALGPWTTLVMVGLAGPDLCLRYLTGIYPLGLAAFAFCFGLAIEETSARMSNIAMKTAACVCVLAALCSWAWPGARDLGSVFDPSKWSSAVRYAPGPLLSRTGLRSMPPVDLWAETTAFLEWRKTLGQQESRGFDQPFLPLDDMSTQGWQPFPEITPALVAQRARLSGESAEAQMRNMGWALAAAKDWNQGLFEALLEDVTDPSVVQALRMGAVEGAKVTGKTWVPQNESNEQSRMDKESGAAPIPGNGTDEVQE